MKYKIGFVGLGKLGLPCAEAIAKKGHEVRGYDIDRVQSDVVKVDSTLKESVENSDIVFVAVPTPHEKEYDGRQPSCHLEPKDFNYDTVKEVVSECDKYMDRSQILVLISTVLPGTVREWIAPRVWNTRFVYNPYLIAMGTVAWDMVNPEMVMIGTFDGKASKEAHELQLFYQTIMENNPRYVIGTWDECECIKVFYNTFISAKIGLVNMIQDVAEAQGNINVDVVTDALRDSTQRIMGPSYMKAGMGDGGACHPRDNIALRYMSNELDLGYDLFDAVMHSRERQAENMAMKILELGSKAYFTSDTYKPKVPYVEGSYSLLVQHFYDFWDGTLCDNIEEADVIVKVHESDDLSDVESLKESKIIFDPWRTHKSDKHKVYQYGNRRSTYDENPFFE